MGKNNDFEIIAKASLLLFTVIFFFYPLALLFFKTIFSWLNFSLFLEIITSNSQLIWNSFFPCCPLPKPLFTELDELRA